jgi:predicted transcriptional regulator
MAISIQLSKETQEKLDKIAEDTERTRSQVIRLAIKEYLEENANSN